MTTRLQISTTLIWASLLVLAMPMLNALQAVMHLEILQERGEIFWWGWEHVWSSVMQGVRAVWHPVVAPLLLAVLAVVCVAAWRRTRHAFLFATLAVAVACLPILLGFGSVR